MLCAFIISGSMTTFYAPFMPLLIVMVQSIFMGLASFLCLFVWMPQGIVWQRVLQVRNTSCDFFYVLWSSQSIIPNYHDRLRFRSGMSSLLLQCNLYAIVDTINNTTTAAANTNTTTQSTNKCNIIQRRGRC